MKKKMFKKLKERLSYIKYTWEHKKAFLKVEKKLRGFNTFRGYMHDVDKLFLYPMIWLSDEWIKNFHRNHTRHHDNNIPKTKEDYIEMIIDWESSRFTKPDKQLNAYDTMKTFYPHLEKDILPIMKELKLL